jgi:hypothetical protein
VKINCIILYKIQISIYNPNRAVVTDVRSWTYKNHLSRAAGLCDIPTIPPLDFESAFMDCSRAISVHTCEKG